MVKILPPRAKMNAGQDYFLGAPYQRQMNIGQHFFYALAAPCAACNPGNTKRAVVIAAILGFNKSPRPFVDSWQQLARQWLQIYFLNRKVQHFGYQVLL